MLIVIGKSKFENTLKSLWEDAMSRVQEELKGLRTVTDLGQKVRQQREELETLKIEKARREEEFAKREREIEHKVGLERKRQEQDLAAAKREATLDVREENLKADRERFEKEMKFQSDRFTQEVGYLKETLGEVLKRLPTAEFTADLTPAPRRRGRD
jgi:hypothetical protein